MSRYLTDIRRAVRTHVLMQKIKPYTRVNIAYLSDVLDVPVEDIESLLVALILDNKIRGRIDQVRCFFFFSSSSMVPTPSLPPSPPQIAAPFILHSLLAGRGTAGAVVGRPVVCALRRHLAVDPADFAHQHHAGQQGLIKGPGADLQT